MPDIRQKDPGRNEPASQPEAKEQAPAIPSISLPKGGGAIRSIGEKFSVSAATGAATFTVPLFVTPGRSGFQPALSLSYNSGAGNGPFGLGWRLSAPSISRRTEKKLPRYRDEPGAEDVFLLSDAEDLVLTGTALATEGTVSYRVSRYRPRVEAAFARIERWQREDTGETHWRTITKDSVTSFFGRTAGARTWDRKSPGKVFEWLIEETRDDRGNIVQYEYKPEDSVGADALRPHDRNRLAEPAAFNNLYLKRIHYGNQQPFQPSDWLFELVFDYGDHDLSDPKIAEAQAWSIRQDGFSTYRPGFEVRTLRLCRRVLMFHHIQDLSPNPYLVRSTDFEYKEVPTGSFLVSATQTGYRQDMSSKIWKRSLPAIELEYAEPQLDAQIRVVEAENVRNLPVGLAGNTYQWVDLDNEGISGVLTDQGTGWFYKRNLGEARFGPVELMAPKPSTGNLRAQGQQLMDIAGNGQLCLADLDGDVPGFFARTQSADWEPFLAFRSVANVSVADPYVRMIDLTGDGIPDIVFSEDDRFVWYPSLGRGGFGNSETAGKLIDEEQGPTVVFADSTQFIYLADMSGDGLTDITRIRNGEVCYWPNLGYGRFGAKVTMDASPWFDSPDQFNQSRIRLADIDGSGTTDIIYLGREELHFWFNQSGNSWSPPQTLAQFPKTDSLSGVTVVDLLGHGTSCIVWSSMLPGDTARPMRYIDLMGSQKPHLLKAIKNNLGSETRIEYAASTKFYLQDRAAGQPWATRLPFPVHVVERVETLDHLTDSTFVARYRYRHGFYDREEREFRGFGMVEQIDGEKYGDGSDPLLRVPPAISKTWFHTGAYLEHGTLVDHYRNEYWPGASSATVLAENTFPAGLTAREQREACRALKGAVLRQEVYAEDGLPLSKNPYTVSDHNYEVRMLHPVDGDNYAVFFKHPRETVQYHYERDPSDPRVMHEITIAVDEFGNPLRSAAIAYPRRVPIPQQPEQEETHITVTENAVINKPGEASWYRLGLPAETRTWELIRIDRTDPLLFTPLQIDTAFLSAIEIRYQDKPISGAQQKRLVEHVRTLYLDKAFLPLKLGEVESLALPYQTYKLAFTDSLIQSIFDTRVDNSLLTEGGYVSSTALKTQALFPQSDSNELWWIPSGQLLFAPAQPFFLPVGARDPFGNETHIIYDLYSLLLVQSEDPVHNVISAKNDYRVMAPRLVTDPNGNRTEVAFDALGMVAGTAVMGKLAESLGDSLTGFEPDLTEAQLLQYMLSPIVEGPTLLHQATTRIVYDLDRYVRTGEPVVASTLARETHVSDLQANQTARIRHIFQYSDGLGREIQTKAPAKPSSAPLRDSVTGKLVLNAGVPQFGHADPRWVGSGRTIYNNKGKPVKQYEPFFSSTHGFENEPSMTMTGVTPVIHYDPLSRAIRTDLPNGTYSKVEFSPWHQEDWDPNDTVKDSLWINSPTTPQIAVSKTVPHAGTPKQTRFDSLGRPYLTIENNGPNNLYETRTEIDIEGNQRSVTDAKGRKIMLYDYDMLGRKAKMSSKDAGDRWILSDIAGRPIRRWDSRGHVLRSVYDALRRPAHLYVKDNSLPEFLAEQTVYGETVATATNNLRGKPYQQFDAAGVVTDSVYDFKGNLLESARQLAVAYQDHPHWDSQVPLQTETFTTKTGYDSLNRPIRMITPDASDTLHVFSESGLLESVSAHLRGSTDPTAFVRSVDYDAKGQRTRIEYGNGAVTEYSYDEKTFRLTRLLTTRPAPPNETILQDLSYTYDPVGNIVRIADAAQRTIFFKNAVVPPASDYTYDAIYRLIEATGREHLGQNGSGTLNQPAVVGPDDSFRANLPHPGDDHAMGNYTETYQYDEVGNILKLIHKTDNGNWTRTYSYDSASNRLLSTNPDGTYDHDAHGNMTRMPHLPAMHWDFADRLQQVDLNGGGTAHYVYDSTGQRVRKVWEKQGTQVEERVYLGQFELFRTRTGNSLTLERETLHVMDDKQRIALVETRTRGSDQAPSQLIRFQFSNHLGSASLELDGFGQIISYQDFYPYGSSSYEARSSLLTPSRNRFKQLGVVRDEETGLDLHGHRYLAAWLGRWISADPAGLIDGVNLFGFALANPITYRDSQGTQSEDSMKQTTFLKGTIQSADIGPVHLTNLQGSLSLGPAPQIDVGISGGPFFLGGLFVHGSVEGKSQFAIGAHGLKGTLSGFSTFSATAAGDEEEGVAKAVARSSIRAESGKFSLSVRAKTTLFAEYSAAMTFDEKLLSKTLESSFGAMEGKGRLAYKGNTLARFTFEGGADNENAAALNMRGYIGAPRFRVASFATESRMSRSPFTMITTFSGQLLGAARFGGTAVTDPDAGLAVHGHFTAGVPGFAFAWGSGSLAADKVESSSSQYLGIALGMTPSVPGGGGFPLGYEYSTSHSAHTSSRRFSVGITPLTSSGASAGMNLGSINNAFLWFRFSVKVR